MKILKNYISSIILLIALAIGGVLGIVLGEEATVLKPFGDIFLNLIFTLLVPIVFFSISSAIANLKSSKSLGKLLIITLLVFATTAIISSIIGVTSFKLFNPAKDIDTNAIISSIDRESLQEESKDIVETIVSSVTVDDFSNLLSRKNILPLIIFSAFIGFATLKSGEKGEKFKEFLNSGSAVTMKVLDFIMYYAPIGLGAYFASNIGQLGGQILSGYAKVFTLYLVVSLVYFFGFFTLYAFIAGKKEGVRIFWKNAAKPSITAIATCSSAACIPVNIEAAKKMGVPSGLAKLIMPLGVNIHKDGSVMGGIFKIMFLFSIYGLSIDGAKNFFIIALVGLLVGAVVGAIPGGGAIGEMLILSLFSLPPEALAIMLVIATIIDVPATLLNSAGNTVCTMVISKFLGEKEEVQSEEVA
ncbi:MAG: dicarboxylate/amino acid:cation symporter [Clostridiaceae bacterium]|nr:dicarboxylate/amino acid:cation symporter [Clostridiaceae bacterium]